MKRKIMIIDDNREFLKQFSESLEICGYVPFSFDKAKSALKKIQKIEPDVILLDIRLGEDCGLDVAKSIREIDGMEQVPIIAITAFFEEEDIKYLKEKCKVFTCLKKPLKPLDVLAAIKNSFT